MPSPLSMDLRSRIAQEFENDILSLPEIAAKFEVSYPSVYRLHKRFKTEGHVNPKFSPRNTGNTIVKNIEEFERFVLENKDMYQYEIAEKFGIAQPTVCGMLKKLGISRKKKHSPFLKKMKKKEKNSVLN